MFKTVLTTASRLKTAKFFSLVYCMVKTAELCLLCIKVIMQDIVFNVKPAIELTSHPMRMLEVRTAENSPCEARFGTHPHISLSNKTLSKTLSSSNLKYTNIFMHYIG